MPGSARATMTTLPTYLFVQPFESSFKYEPARAWLEANYHLPILAISCYLSLLGLGQMFMKSRQPFDLKRPLLAWNVLLALFSICGAARSLPELYHVLTKLSLHHSVCFQGIEKPLDGVYSFWCFLFVMSKILELGDTAFIVLRKQKLLFLHWYHHVSVLIFGWFSSMGPLSFGRWIMSMNFAVHSLMYSYYALRILGVRVPKQVAMAITTLQIAQMLMGCYVTLHAWWTVSSGQECEISPLTLNMSIICYGSYLVLFLNFFVRSYFGSSRKGKKDVNENLQKPSKKKLK